MANGRTLATHQLSAVFNGSPSHLENVASSTVNARNATAFEEGAVLLLVNDGTGKTYFNPGTSTVVGSATTGVPLNQDEKLILVLKRGQTHLGFITASGTSTIRIYKME